MKASEFTTEDNFGTHPKRPARTGSRHPRGHEPVPRYKTVTDTDSDKTAESVAGPKNCWPNHRKVGTQPGTGKNAGKRVNDCEKIKKEDVAEDYNPEYDDEAGMADNNLETLARAVEGIDDVISAGDNLPEWCQEKIAVAKSMLVAVWDYMKSEENIEQGVTEGSRKAWMKHNDLVDLDPALKGLEDEMEKLIRLDPEERRKYQQGIKQRIKSEPMAGPKGQLPEQGVAEGICSIQEANEIFDDFERSVAARGLTEDIFDSITDEQIIAETAAWRRKEGKSKTGGLNAKGVASYRRENPGSKLQTAVTTKPSKLKPGSKAAKRRKSFCARMSGVKGPMKKPNGKPTRKALALRKWNC